MDWPKWLLFPIVLAGLIAIWLFSQIVNNWENGSNRSIFNLGKY